MTKKSRIVSEPEVKQEEITYSRLSRFLECPMKEYYSYRVNGTGIKPVQTPVPFIEGSFLHYALEHFHGQGQQMLRKNLEKKVVESINELGAIDVELHNKLQTKLAAMMGACFGYKVQYIGDKKRYETLGVEVPFELDFEGFKLRGKIDWIAKEIETGHIIIFENKSTSSSTGQLTARYTQLPLDLQGLIYGMGAETILKKMPDYKGWNFIVKTKLRRRGSIEKGNLETLPSYEARIQNEYVEAPEKMFFRPPPLKILPRHTDFLKAELIKILKRWDDEPCMSFNCLGMFGLPCTYLDACREKMAGVKDGWDSGKCLGLYKLKEAQYTELI